MPAPQMNMEQVNSSQSNFTGLAGNQAAVQNNNFGLNSQGYKPSNYGFASQPYNAGIQRGANIVMNAASSSVEPSSDDQKEPLVNKEDQAEINKRNFNPLYAYFVLFIVLACRIMVQWHRKGLTYAYGYTYLGDAANKANYEIATSFP
jgi:hypothetical protein